MPYTFDPVTAKDVLALMIRSRVFEQKIEELFTNHSMHGTTHLAIGQEAVHAGVALGLEQRDWIMTTHRCHGHTLARGADLSAMMAEFFGDSRGLSRGLGGSMHLIDMEHRNAGSSAVVGSSVALAAGMALQLKRQNRDEIVVAFFGDGASNRGIIHEAMNMASIWNLPVLFLCEHNGYGMSSPAHRMVSVSSIAERGAGYGIESDSIDGNDVQEVYSRVREIRQWMMEQQRPYLLEVKTYRFSGHSKSDKRVYRTREEEAQWMKRDPIEAFSRVLIAEKEITDQEISDLFDQERAKITEIADFFLQDHQELTLNEAEQYVYASGGDR